LHELKLNFDRKYDYETSVLDCNAVSCNVQSHVVH